MKVHIHALQTKLTDNEIKNAVPLSVINRIKQKDPKPLLQAYSIVQEGTSRPRVIGEGATPISWPRQAVEAVGTVIKKGLQFFNGHNSDSSTEGRKPLGEVIGSITKEIGGRLNQIVIGYFPDKKSAQNYDVCSIEADVVLRDSGESVVAEAISKITGIALGNSAYDTPAFAGAVRLGSIQAFGTEDDPQDTIKGVDKKTTGEVNQMTTTYEEVKQFIKDNHVWPNKLYDESVMREDHVFGKAYQELDILKSEKETLQTEFNDLKTTYETEQRAGAVTTAKSRIPFPEGITDRQKDFITTKFDEETPDDLTDEGLSTFVSGSLDKYKSYAKMFGVPDGETDSSDDPENPSTIVEKTVNENASNMDLIVNDTLS